MPMTSAGSVGRVGLIASPFIVLWLFNNYGIMGVNYGIMGVILAVSGMYVAATLVYAFARIDTSAQALASMTPKPALR